MNINRTAEQLIHLHIAGEDVTISLDLVGKEACSSGGTTSSRAPLNEVLTAGLLALASWKPGMALVDPMLGQAPFPLRRAFGRLACRCAERRDWTLFGMPQFNAKLWREVGSPFRSNIDRAPILASDWNKHPVGDAREASGPWAWALIRVEVADFLDLNPRAMSSRD